MTDEDKKLILEWCGWYQKDDVNYLNSPIVVWVRPDGTGGCTYMPELDPNFYFKYTAPKLREKFGNPALYKFLNKWVVEIARFNEDPAEAFGQALLKLIKDVKVDAIQT